MKTDYRAILIALVLLFVVRWANASLVYSGSTPVSVPNSSLTHVYGINNSGQYVGVYQGTGGTRGFYFDGSAFQDVRYPGASGVTMVWGLNNSGAIVGSYSDASGSHAFWRSATGQYNKIITPSTNFSVAYGINDQGDIVGDFSMGGAADGFLYRGGQIQVFDFGTSFTQLNDIGNNGLIVGNYGYEGFVLNPDTGERSNFTVNQYQTIARSVNSAGDLVGSFFAGGRTQSYVRHQDGSIEVFPFPTAYDMGAMGVNDSGDIVGISGSSAFLIRGAVPPPVVQNVSEPESLALMLVGLSMLGLSVRRKNIQSGGRHRSTALA